MSEFLDSLDTSKMNEYEINKKNWLVETEHYYTSENTIKKYWNVLIDNSINVLERAWKKDLYSFNHSEIIEALNYAPTIRFSSKSTLLSVISKYREWSQKRGFSIENPCDTISINDIKINTTAFKLTYTKLDDFYKELNNLRCSDVDKMTLVMLRYGIKLRDIPFIEWQDLKRDENIILVKSGNKTLRIPIDENFIKYVDKAKEEDNYIRVSKTKSNRKAFDGIEKERYVGYMDYGYIIKSTKILNVNIDKSDTVNEHTLRSRLNQLSQQNTIDNKEIKRPSPINYNDSRKYDFLFEIYNKNKQITRSDAEQVLEIFEERVTVAKVALLKKNFELLTSELSHK